MNVQCSNCPAKYAISDAKIKGRKVKITCKKCNTPIIVDGTKVSDEGETAVVGTPGVRAFPSDEACSARWSGETAASL